VLIPGYLPDLPEVRQELADQYEAVNRLDVGIGMVLEALKRSGKADQTLVVYLSDNGIPFPGAKTNLYDSGTHVPLILSLPGSEHEGTVNRSMVSLIDVLPTVLEWTGARPPSYTLPGSSFLKSIGQDDDVGRNEVFGTYTFHEVTMFYPMRSIRTRRYRYIHNLFPQLEFPFATDLFVSRTWQAILKEKVQKMGKRSTKTLLFRPQEELYDLELDPDEATNVALDSKYADVLQELRARLLAMRTRTDDHWLINDNYAVNAETFRSK
jgi:N-sulfoglucosamine sulfohydrolase